MAAVYWLGTAAAVAQVGTASIDSVDGTPANNTFFVTIGGVSISAVGDTDVATTATNLRASLNASTNPYFAAITWSGSAGDIIGTADNAGQPFVAALTETGAGTGAVTDFAGTTASSGPYDWSTAANWSGGAVPVNSDVAYLDAPGSKVLYGLAQSAVTLAELHVRQDTVLGLRAAQYATDAASTTYATDADEYRETYLEIKATLVRIGEHLGPGSPTGSARCKINNSITTASTTEVFNTASAPTETELPAVRLLYADADADLFLRSARGGVGVAMDTPGETTTIGNIYISDPSSVSRLFVGDGVTMTLLSVVGGISVVNSAAAIPTATINGGTHTIEGDQVITAATVNAGKLVPNNVTSGSVCITTLTQEGGEVDLQQSSVPRTVTTWNYNKGTRRIDDHVTITNDNRSGRVAETVV